MYIFSQMTLQPTGFFLFFLLKWEGENLYLGE